MSNPQLILHWYPNSPFAQKVAWALQYKNVDFKLVVISPIEPRPLRRPLDAGYRKTPVLQIGNHTYCDSKAIFAELEKRFPEPTFYPLDDQGNSTEHSALSLARWTEGSVFQAVVSQIPMGALGEAFVKDRGQFSGRKIDPESLAFTAPYMLQSLNAELQAVENLVKSRHQNGSLWALGTKALSLADLHIAMNVWFLGQFVGNKWLKSNVPVLNEHLKKTLVAVRFKELGNLVQINAEKALVVAREQSWKLASATHDGSLKAKLGQVVSVMPTDTGLVPSIGTLVHSTIHETVIENQHEEYGFASYTHFPVIGFVVLPHTPKL
ncbi:hypothetical protein BD408DRAFT_486263 [Parasitella parasitica]|nr:hypothetical protein BD408DRAFT_486263 [Parasitella parasitica]